MKKLSLADILTPEQIVKARKLYRKAKMGEFNKLIVPMLDMDRINRLTGQENDPRYMGYAVEYFMMMEKQQ